MEMKSVTSSQIKEISHDHATNTLAIRFKSGALYHYNNVQASMFKDFLSAESKDRFFGEFIRPHHQHTKVS